MNSDSYQKGAMYEAFIRRAHQSVKTSSNGADSSFMQNLIDMESGRSNVKHLGSADKQVEKVKGYIDKALDKFLSKKLTDEERQQLTILKMRTERAYSSADLMGVVNAGLEATQRFR